MAIALEHELEAEMVAAQDGGNEAAFVAARNKRQALWDYKAGAIDLAQAKYRLGKGTASAACLAWNGETD